MDSALIKALFKADAYAHEIAAVSLVETHISWVLLTGRYAYKIKKPVNFGFLDFSTLENRRFYCYEELRLNRRLAADLYLDVVPITGTPARPKMGGVGEAIEYAVRMIQFPAGYTLSERAGRGQLSAEDCDQITAIIAGFHETIDRADAASPYGGSECINHWFVENFDHIGPLLADAEHKWQLRAIQAWGEREWNGKAGLMQRRKQQGQVRECHGDLHLSNMTLVDGKVVLFDCIEFNPRLRWIDVISEIAFLVIDLLHFGHDRLAYRFLNHYLQHTGDYRGVAVLRYYLVYRALVLAKVALLRQVQQHGAAVSAPVCEEYTGFANLAERFTRVGRVALIITHGYSGSGKSTLAGQLAEKTGALQIRSDVERKRLFGYGAQERTASGLDGGVYTAEAGLKTYQHLADCAKAVLEAGFPAIIDAAFLRIEQRDLFRRLAADLGAPFMIIDFQASEEELCRRIGQRQNDVSEATIDVLRRQLQSAQPLSPEEQVFAITINTENDNALEMVLDALGSV